MGFPEPINTKYLPKPRTIRYVPINQEGIEEVSVKEFEALTHIRYLYHLEFDTEATYKKVKNLCKNVIGNENRNKRSEWMGIHYRKEVLNGFVNDVYIKWVDDRYGFGLFANKHMETGEYIGEYLGIVRPVTYLFANVNPYCFRYPLYSIGFKVYTIDAQDACNETSFVNHCNHPNCDAVVTCNNDILHVCLVANREIKEGEQLTYDYGNNLWNRSF